MVSFIGSLEQLKLSAILQRIEAHSKTGLLLVKQGEQWVDLYFRQGQLVCIGPVRSNSTLAERLQRAGVISQEALQNALSRLGSDQFSETRTAVMLTEHGYVTREDLYRWAIREATKVIKVLLTWATGEIYFEENQPPPENRLLIALPVSSLLPQYAAVPTPQPVGAPFSAASVAVQERPGAGAVSLRISEAPTLHGTTRLFEGTAAASSISGFAAESFLQGIDRNTDSLRPSFTVSVCPPQPVTGPIPAIPVNTTYMQPQMVLVPTNLSAYREQNPAVMLTPEQWRLFTRADGQTSLLAASQALGMTREQICQVAGELIALGLVIIAMPGSGAVNELSPISRDFINAGIGNGYIAPGAAAAPVQPWAASAPAIDTVNHYSSPRPIETHSQWGNGGNGAIFVLGNGWVVAPTSSRPASGQLQLPGKEYVQAVTGH